jgi:hypothetical protein
LNGDGACLDFFETCSIRDSRMRVTRITISLRQAEQSAVQGELSWVERNSVCLTEKGVDT